MPRLALAGLAAVALLAAGCGSGAKAAQKTPAVAGKSALTVRRIGSLPQVVTKAAAVALPHGRLMVLGGYAGGRSLETILAGPPSRLRILGRLPNATHDAGAVAVHGSVYLFGGGEQISMPSVVRVNPVTGSAVEAPALGEPLSDLGAVAIGGRAYIVGGFTGAQFASGIIRYLWQGGETFVARLPQGTRYAGVAAVDGKIYVAGGLTPTGPIGSVYAVVPGGRARLVATLPAPEDHAALAALGGRLYLVGGRRVLAIDPRSGRVSVAARLPAYLSDPTATTVGRRIIVTGGGTNGVWTLTR